LHTHLEVSTVPYSVADVLSTRASPLAENINTSRPCAMISLIKNLRIPVDLRQWSGMHSHFANTCLSIFVRLSKRELNNFRQLTISCLMRWTLSLKSNSTCYLYLLKSIWSF